MTAAPSMLWPSWWREMGRSTYPNTHRGLKAWAARLGIRLEGRLGYYHLLDSEGAVLTDSKLRFPEIVVWLDIYQHGSGVHKDSPELQHPYRKREGVE